jgi:hypothetical protein
VRRMRIHSIIVIFIVGIPFISGCLSNSDIFEEKGYLFYYEISISSENVDHYLIYLPQIDGWNTLIDDISLIDGDGVYSIIDMEFGNVLSINSSQDIHINAEREFEHRPEINISLFNQTSFTGRIYCGIYPIEAQLTLLWLFTDSTINEKGGGYGYNLDGELNNGWNELVAIEELIGG